MPNGNSALGRPKAGFRIRSQFGTLDRSPPPFFRQGPSALSKMVLFAAMAIFLMAADGRFKIVEPLRDGLAITLLPLQQALALPVQLWEQGADYLRDLHEAQSAAAQAQRRLAEMAERAARTEQLAREHQSLRAMLELRPALPVRSVAAEISHAAADPYSRKVFIDRGSQHGVVAGSPVINEAGMLGQVTRAYALTAEVTLLSDKDAAIPVINLRTQQRSVAFGLSGGMELRFLSGQADIQIGDPLQTSGLDGIYPPGLPVGAVSQIERRQDSGFARVLVTPTAPIDISRHVLVLQPVGLPDAATPAAKSAQVQAEGAASSPVAAQAPTSAPTSAAAATPPRRAGAP